MKKCLSSTALSLIAASAMLADHAAAVFLSDSAVYSPMRAIGRITFPIFLFLLIEGVEHTSSKPRYLARLAVFAVISELPFDLLFYKTAFYPQHQNTMFTLLICAAMLMLRKRFENEPILVFASFAACAVLADIMRVDGGSMAVLLALVFGCGKNFERAGALLLFSLINNLFAGYNILTGLYIWNMAALPLILCYNGKRGGENCPKPIRKWGFYAFYSLHLAAFATIVRF